jgi:hypothetical protein
MEIPAGALSEPVTITATPDTISPAGLVTYSSTWTFEPDGLVFALPVSVRLAHTPATAPISVWWTDELGAFMPLPTTFDEPGWASATIVHFSQGVVAEGEDDPCADGVERTFASRSGRRLGVTVADAGADRILWLRDVTEANSAERATGEALRAERARAAALAAALDAVPLPLTLRPTPSYTLVGSVAEGIDLDGRGLTVVPSADGAAGAFLDQALTSPWSLSFTDAPPEDHMERDGGLGSAVEIPLSYLDLDGSGDLTDGDAAAEAVCLDDRAVAMLYVEPPTALYAAYVLTLQGLGAGWSPLAVSADGSIATITEAELVDVQVSGDCSL